MRRLAFPTVRFHSIIGALRVSLCWPLSFLGRGALLPYTANGAHYSLRGWLLAIDNAGMAGIM